MKMVAITQNPYLLSILYHIGFNNIKFLNENLNTQPNEEIIIVDDINKLSILRRKISFENTNILAFVSGLPNNLNSKKGEKIFLLCFESIFKNLTAKDFIGNLSKNLTNDNANIYRDTATIEGDIRNTPEEALDNIISFMEYFEIENEVDINDVIIASSEVIDNIIEATINISSINVKILIDLIKTDNLFIIRIGDYLGLADVSSISRSLVRKEIESNHAYSSFFSSRGRGYTLIKQTSDMVITRITSPNSYRKYNFENPFTETSLVYFLNHKSNIPKLGTVIEYI
ncbi:MAG: hypothetical protein N2712_06340 [Brevinematales bacterium]|nr:hypothetical protein [Brevinematales bacterium]